MSRKRVRRGKRFWAGWLAALAIAAATAGMVPSVTATSSRRALDAESVRYRALDRLIARFADEARTAGRD